MTKSRKNGTRRRDWLRLAAVAAGSSCFPRRLVAADRLPTGVVQAVEHDAATGAARAVVVGDVPLAHTGQVSATSVAAAFDRLDELLRTAGSSLRDAVHLNFYGPAESCGASLVAEAADRFTTGYRPTVTYAVMAPLDPQRPLAVDAVAVSSKTTEPGRVLRFDGAAVLPPTNKLYVSGDAAAGSLIEATRGTLQSLERTLTYCGLDWSHVVQLKAFMQPIAAAADVRAAMQSFFGDRPVPVLSFVEWRSSEKLPIEIELIAAVPPESGNTNGEPVEYLTPPGMTASPVFSRAARVCSRRTIYVSGLYGNSSDPTEQVRDVLGALQRTVELLGGDLRHLVKATYYVSDDAVSKALGAIRPEFYDPARPPAASKAMIAATGREGRTLTLDMIAVPRRGA